MTKYILVTGNPQYGIKLYGPFDSAKNAATASDKLDEPGWIVPLHEYNEKGSK